MMDSANLTHLTVDPATSRSAVLRWFLHDIFFIAMLVLALAGVIFRLPVSYWVLLMPVFAVITIAEGWSHFADRAERLGLVVRVGLNWLALLVAIYLLSSSGVAGVMNANAGSLAMMTLLALGTFVAGVQGRVWQIIAIGSILFLAVPALGWLDQSPLLLATGACAVVALGGFGWWITERRGADETAVSRPAPIPAPHSVAP
jgi:hypothetical protein